MRKNYNYYNYPNYATGPGNRIVINCINCLSKLRVPMDKGRILVTCPVCKKTFAFNPRSIIHTIRQIFMLVKILIFNIRKKTIPSIKYKLKSYYYNNKKTFFTFLIIALIMVFIFVALLLELKNLKEEEPNIDIPRRPGPVAILQ